MSIHITSDFHSLVDVTYNIWLPAQVKPPPDQFRDILESGGGEFLASLPAQPGPGVYVVSCPEDKSLHPKVLDSRYLFIILLRSCCPMLRPKGTTRMLKKSYFLVALSLRRCRNHL